ncbi:MAG: transporter ATP-binding protein [Ilumatobacteraceae bacterium]|nr:transporter ATP-binding protein [Ilumatobacteraceae bacterium]
MTIAGMSEAQPGLSVWRIAWRVSQHHRRSFWLGWLGFVFYCTFPALSGWLLGRGFDAVAHHHSGQVYAYAFGVLLTETGRMTSIHFGALIWTEAWVHMQTLIRSNLLAAQMASGGPESGQPVGSAGEAVTHFRDDAEDVAMFIDGLVDVSAGVVFTAVAGFLLGSVDPSAALILVVPLLGVALATRTLDHRIKRYRADDRLATAAVSGLVGDLMASATTVKVNDAVEPALGKLRGLVDRRRQTAVRDRVLDEGVQAFSQGAADVGLGLVLLVSASALASGSFDVGRLALFTAYLGWLSFLPRTVGRVLARRKQVAVAVDRMRFLVADELAANVVAERALPIAERDVRFRPDAIRPERVPLRSLAVRGLGAQFANGAGARDIDFEIRRGTFTVITGPIGSGKTTLLRALLGLVHHADVRGQVSWNDRPMLDRAAFLVPPNCAFLPQVPQLVSDSVAENIALGAVDEERLRIALELAAVSDDIAGMPDGTATMIGPRGLRLSGGQRQRVATARALVHAPELVVLDDLSSALDVETELELWANLAAAGMTVIAVSHRAVALERADQILRLEGGRLVR